MAVDSFADVLHHTSVCTKIVLLLAPGSDCDPEKLANALQVEAVGLRESLGPSSK